MVGKGMRPKNLGLENHWKYFEIHISAYDPFCMIDIVYLEENNWFFSPTGAKPKAQLIHVCSVKDMISITGFTEVAVFTFLATF